MPSSYSSRAVTRPSRASSRGGNGHSFSHEVKTTDINLGSGCNVHIREEKTRFQAGSTSGHTSYHGGRGDDDDSDTDEDVNDRLSALRIGGGRSQYDRSGSSVNPRIQALQYEDAGNSLTRHSGSRQSSSGYSHPRDDFRYSGSGYSAARPSESRTTSSRHSTARPSDSRTQSSRHSTARPSESRTQSSRHSTARPTDSRLLLPSRASSSRHSTSRPSESGAMVIYEDRVPTSTRSSSRR